MKRWLHYVKPYLAYFIIGPICMIVEVIGEVIMPKLLSNLIDYLTNQTTDTTVELSEFAKAVESIFGENYIFVITLTAAMIITALLMMIGGVGGAYFGAKAAVNYAADLRRDIYAKVQKFSFANIDHFSTSSLVTRLTNDVTQIQNFVNMMLRMALRAPGMFIGALIMAFITNKQLTTVFAISLPLLITVLAIIIVNGFPKFSKLQESVDGLNSTVQENITNARVVKSFVREEHEKVKFSAANKRLKNAGLDAMLRMILMSPIMSFFMYATTLAVLWFGGNQVIDTTLTPGELSMFITYATQILSSLMMVSFVFVMLSRALASAKRINEVLDEKINIESAAEAGTTPVKRGEIEFKNVSFRYYKNSEGKALDSVSLTIPAGKTVGIIGSTGCGKTTLVSLIPRLYDADEGEVLVDGVNVRDYSLYDLREGVGMVLQQNVLFSGTIEENLRWGDDQATEEQIHDACRTAQADNFITSFPDGYDSQIERGGANVSGGQKQRLCIARALLKHPKILILDDSTSAVDTATEKNIRAAFKNELADSTKIIIAQRISSVRDADMIVVMNDGKITGIGTHDELMQNNEEYSEIYYSQNDKEDAR